MITAEMQKIVEENTIGLVASVTAQGSPRVSPKGTMLVLDPMRIAFSDIRSPGTVANLRANPAVEVSFIDIFRRKACRLRGMAVIHERGTAEFEALLPRFRKWESLVDRMQRLVVVVVEAAELVTSPIYDVGAEEQDLRRQWLAIYGELHGSEIE